MSIDELGERLVKEGRRRRDRQRKRQERFQTRAAIAQIAVPVAGRIIEDNLQQKAQDFFNQEEVLNLKRQHSKAVRESNSIFATRDAIAAASQSPEEYFYDQVYGTVESEMIDAARAREQEEGLNLLGRNVTTGDNLNQALIGSIKGAATELAEERAKGYRESLSAAESVVSSEQFDSMMANKLKDSTPTSIVDAIGRKINTMFGGTSTEERQRMAVNDIRNHHFSTSAVALSAFNKEYENSRSIRDALEYADLAKEIDEYVPRKINEIKAHQLISRQDGSMVQVRTTQKVFEDGTMGDVTIDRSAGSGDVVQEIPGLGAELTEAQKISRVNSARAGFDVSRDGSRMVGQKVFMEEFVDNLELVSPTTGRKILPSNAQNLDDYNLVLGAWNDWITKNQDKIIDPEVQAMDREWLLMSRTVMANSESLRRMEIELQMIETPDGLGLESVLSKPSFQEVQKYIDTINLNPNAVEDLEKPKALDMYRDIAQKNFEVRSLKNAFLNLNRLRYEELGQ